MIRIVLGIHISSCFLNVRFSVLTTVFLMIQVVWVVMPCGLVNRNLFPLLGPGAIMIILNVGINELCV